MAGRRPVERAREREAALAAQRAAGRAKPRAKRVNVATRRVTVERAAKIGDAAAAAEAGVSSATVRSWRRRLKDHTAPVSAEASALAPDIKLAVGRPRLAQMKATRDRAHAIVDAAAIRSEQLLLAGNDVGHREQSAAAKMWASTAAGLEEAVAIAESAETRLTDGQGKRIGTLINDFCAAVGVPRTLGARKVLRALLLAVEDEAGLDPSDAERARQEIREHFRRELAVEFAAEAAAEEKPDEPTDADDVAVEPEQPSPAVSTRVDIPAPSEPRPERYVPPRKSSRIGMFSYPGSV